MPWSTMNFNVVEFHDGLHVIPFSWLSNDNKQAYWPPYECTIRMCKAVVNMETPMKDHWELLDVLAILGSAGKLITNILMLRKITCHGFPYYVLVHICYRTDLKIKSEPQFEIAIITNYVY